MTMAIEALPRCREVRWIHVAEAARLISKSGSVIAERTVRWWCQIGKLPAKKRMGGHWWIDLRSLKAVSDDGRDVYEDIVQAINDEGR